MMTLKKLCSFVAALALVACSGGGGSAGTAPFGNGGGGSSAGASDLVLTLSSSTITNTGGGAVTATATAVDANRNTVANVPITFSVDSNAVVAAAGTATDSAGTVAATVTIGSDTTLRTITVKVSSGGLSKSLPLQVTNSTVSGNTASLTVTLSSSDVTSATPADVTVTLRDNQGNALANTVVTLSTARGSLATTNVSSLLTNAAGTATTQLQSSGSGVQGADQLIATATVGGATVQGQAGFNVRADSPTLSISPSAQNIRFSQGGGTVSVIARDAAGVVQPNVLVAFAAANGLVAVGSPSVLTDAGGSATTTVKPLSPSSSGIDIVSASATVSGRALLSRGTVQVVGEAPSLVVGNVSSSTITTTTPATLRVVARDLQGNLLPNAVVTFKSGTGLVTFTPATQATNSQGEASTVVAPASASSNGADAVTASITVQGVTATAQQLFQVTASTPTGTPTLGLALSSTSISAASPATVTATLKDAQGNGVPGQVVSFSVSRGLATTNIPTALTQSGASAGNAVVVLSPSSATSAGADDVTASVSYGGVTLTKSLGFQVQATPVTLDSFVSNLTDPQLAAYGQTALTLSLTGASSTSPVAIAVSSSCVSLGKATLSPANFTATSGTVTIQYRDNGCGAVQASDQLQAVVTATGTSKSLSLPIAAPADSSIAFISASPEQIYLKGSGFTESSVVTFEVRDAAGNQLPNRQVTLLLQTGAGGVTMEGLAVNVPTTLTSNANGRVSVRVNSGTVPTPVRVSARLANNAAISTVSSNLSVAVGLPSQLNFSLSQTTRNIEGYEIDGIPNEYQIIAADRSGNPVPAGTSINFVTEGGQIEAIRQTALVNGIARTTAQFVSSSPRPIDGRVTVTAYALGEESFIDQNGNNQYDLGEPFQDLGSIFKDRIFDGIYDLAVDEFIPLTINNSSACIGPTSFGAPGNLLLLDASIPSIPVTCDGVWSGAGKVYVRRAIETVLSTSSARPLWPTVELSNLVGPATTVRLQVGSSPSEQSNFRVVAGNTYCAKATDGAFSIIVADANPGLPKTPFVDPLTDYIQFPRLNPVAAGTIVTASTNTVGFGTLVVGGITVPSTSSATQSVVGFTFTDSTTKSALINLTFTSPKGTVTSTSVRVVRAEVATAAGCP